MIFYLTFNDGPSGIYSSQVIDVVKFIRNELKSPIRLVSFISLRQFLKCRNIIKGELADAIVVPMIPGIKRWPWNAVLLNFLFALHRPGLIIGRSILATQLALRCKKSKQKVVYDGRGAIAAEWKEYNVINDQKLLHEVKSLEHSAIHNSDFRIAVSEQLVNYWQDEYGYAAKHHVVIPCTLNAVFEQTVLSVQKIKEQRETMGLRNDDIIYVYSGSLAGWQSFDLLYEFVAPLLSLNKSIKLMFLSDRNDHISKLELEFPYQIICMKVQPREVPSYLICSDYGLLIREESITNKVASPVKFAEYLACGLQILISKDLGDYSEFVKENECGYILNANEIQVLTKIGFIEKKRLHELALKSFTKKKYLSQYKFLISISQ